jgi:hypothetical protein
MIATMWWRLYIEIDEILASVTFVIPMLVISKMNSEIQPHHLEIDSVELSIYCILST